MEDWFKPQAASTPAAGTANDPDYPAYKDEDENPFKKDGLLKKSGKIVFATLGKELLDHTPTRPGKGGK
jgi:hypothetical protein